MLTIHEGQCGLCAHYGEEHQQTEALVQMRVKGEAPETFVDTCGLPDNADLHLKVTPISGCDGFTPAKVH